MLDELEHGTAKLVGTGTLFSHHAIYCAHGGSSSSRAPSGAKYSSTAASLTCSSAAGDQRGALVRVRVRVRVGVEALCRGLGWGWSWG